MNIFISPVFALTFAIVFIIVGGYCLKCILFYHENKDKLNDEKFTKYDELKFQFDLNKKEVEKAMLLKNEFLRDKLGREVDTNIPETLNYRHKIILKEQSIKNFAERIKNDTSI